MSEPLEAIDGVFLSFLILVVWFFSIFILLPNDERQDTELQKLRTAIEQYQIPVEAK